MTQKRIFVYNELMKTQTFTEAEVKHIAHLARIPVSDSEAEDLASGFTKVLEVVDTLKKADTSDVKPTHQVTGLENVMREDVIDEHRMLTQEEALREAKRTHNGYFVVDQVLDK